MKRRRFLRIAASASAALHLRRALGAEEPIAGNDALALPLDLREVPLSHAGSYLTLLHDDDPALPLQLSTVRKTAATYRYQTGAWSHDLMRFGVPKSGAGGSGLSVRGTTRAIYLRSSELSARIFFDDPETLQIIVERGTLRLVVPRAFGWRVISPGVFKGLDGASGHIYELHTAATGMAYRRIVDPEKATREEWTLSAGAGGTKATLRLKALVEPVLAERPLQPGLLNLDEWMQRCPRFSNDDTEAKRRATRIGWFLFWNLQVAPSGTYRRKAILSSKLSLSQVWSWDNLFNALAVVRADPQLAWTQLLLILDHQMPDGMLPDTVSDERATYGYTKPPLWGWTVQRLLLHTPAEQRLGYVRSVYAGIASFHRWWFRERNLRGDGVPVYLSGNDSGWDNSSIFDGDLPVQSPDLLAFLILDAEALAEMAGFQGLMDEARSWRTEAAASLARFTKTFVRGDQLVYIAQTENGWEERVSTSLLTRMPVLLGMRLPGGLLRTLIRELSNPMLFSAPCGPASEALNSPKYDSNGYWRGPVWGPSTYLVCEGVRAAGEEMLANELGERYRETCARKATFRENYDAKTGAGQYDSGMTWCAADYLLLGAHN